MVDIFRERRNVTMHTPVLLNESIEALQVQADGKYIDATYGLGGHSRAIREAGGRVLALDWDKQNVERYKKKAAPEGITLVRGNYADIKPIAEGNNWIPCQGIIFDLGLSMEQIRSSGRGFSYKAGSEPLDMRIDTSQQRTAAEIINSFSTQELYGIFARNAEEISSRPIAEAIYQSRRVKRIGTVEELCDVVRKVTKDRKAVARIFQALRVEVNEEFRNIRRGLHGAHDILESKGRIVVISFHQSEDRIVKSFIRENKFYEVAQKPIKSSSARKFERSASLRIIEK